MKRQEAIKILMHCGAENYCHHYIETRRCYGCNRREALDMAIEALSKLTGKWIEYEPAKVYWNGEEVYAYMNNYTCSVCGGEAHIKYDYCPNCGAMMLRGDGEE